MKLSELVNTVGDANIAVQRVDSSLEGARLGKDDMTRLTVVTDQLTPNDVIGITEGVPPKMHGLIIWIPRDKIPT